VEEGAAEGVVADASGAAETGFEAVVWEGVEEIAVDHRG
jgi:hypothetical protein